MEEIKLIYALHHCNMKIFPTYGDRLAASTQPQKAFPKGQWHLILVRVALWTCVLARISGPQPRVCSNVLRRPSIWTQEDSVAPSEHAASGDMLLWVERGQGLTEVYSVPSKLMGCAWEETYCQAPQLLIPSEKKEKENPPEPQIFPFCTGIIMDRYYLHGPPSRSFLIPCNW